MNFNRQLLGPLRKKQNFPKKLLNFSLKLLILGLELFNFFPKLLIFLAKLLILGLKLLNFFPKLLILLAKLLISFVQKRNFDSKTSISLKKLVNFRSISVDLVPQTSGITLERSSQVHDRQTRSMAFAIQGHVFGTRSDPPTLVPAGRAEAVLIPMPVRCTYTYTSAGLSSGLRLLCGTRAYRQR